MWTRKQLKERGKKAFTANYWKCLLVALIFAMIAGGGGSGYSGGGGRSGAGAFGTAAEVDTVEDTDADTDEDANDEADDNEVTNQGDVEFAQSFSDSAAQKGVKVAALIIGGIVAVVIVLLVLVIASVVSAFVLNPFELGCCRFFYRNLDEPAKVSNVVYAFDHNYMNLVKNLFFRDLYVMLWSLLFIIPGIVKAYEYRMIPYILQDNPEMSKDEVFDLSRKMMTGNKWKAFVLDLSFMGWHILSLFTCGLLSIFYVSPYQNSTNAALYEAIKLENGAQGDIVYEA
ncbi:MAG: DUF975 family protein [Lachnospiraceae bacterium]|nr:DUF975 family protein [Lachnospiraceae bacterium]